MTRSLRQRSVMGPDVDDEASIHLMRRFYEHLNASRRREKAAPDAQREFQASQSLGTLLWRRSSWLGHEVKQLSIKSRLRGDHDGSFEAVHAVGSHADRAAPFGRGAPVMIYPPTFRSAAAAQPRCRLAATADSSTAVSFVSGTPIPAYCRQESYGPHKEAGCDNRHCRGAVVDKFDIEVRLSNGRKARNDIV
jgi:hypothetical protein